MLRLLQPRTLLFLTLLVSSCGKDIVFTDGKLIVGLDGACALTVGVTLTQGEDVYRFNRSTSVGDQGLEEKAAVSFGDGIVAIEPTGGPNVDFDMRRSLTISATITAAAGDDCDITAPTTLTWSGKLIDRRDGQDIKIPLSDFST